MAAPGKYTPSFSFSGYQATQPDRPLPGPRHDTEYFNIAYSLGQTIDALGDIRRDDGKLENGIVDWENLAPGLGDSIYPDAPSDGHIYGRTDATWQRVVTVRIGDNPPGGLHVGDLFWESDTGDLFVNYNDGDSTQLVQVAGPGMGAAADAAAARAEEAAAEAEAAAAEAEEAAAEAEAAADIAAGYASDAVSQGNVPIYATVVGMPALSVPVGIGCIRINGYHAAGDGGGAMYKKVGSQPSHAGKVQTLDGAWWEIAEGRLDARMFGVVFDYNPVALTGTDNYAAIMRLINETPLGPPVGTGGRYQNTPKIHWPRGTGYCSQEINVKRFIHWEGPDAAEDQSSSCKLFFPKGVSHITLHSYNTTSPDGAPESPTTTGADGSIIQGIKTQAAVQTISGRVLEYNAATGHLAYIRAGAAPANGQALEFCNAREPDPDLAVTGAGTVGGAEETAVRTIIFSSKTGTFAVGEAVTSSGASGTVVFVSAAFNAISVKTVTGTFVVGNTVTGGTSGATGVTLTAATTGGSIFVRVVPLTGVTGTIVDGALFREAGVHGSGFTLLCRASIRDCGTTYAAEHGLRLLAGNASYGGNANSTHIAGFQSSANGGNGVIIAGGDVNVFKIERVNAAGNSGWGIVDNSFLGGVHQACHASTNLAGGYNSESGSARHSVFDGCYSESYPSLVPWTGVYSLIGHPNVVIGGAHGLPILTGAGAAVPATVVRGGRIVTRGMDFQNTNAAAYDGMLNLRRDSGSAGNIALSLENVGNAGAERGVGIQFLGPNVTSSALCAVFEQANDGGGIHLRARVVSGVAGPAIAAVASQGEGFQGHLEVAGGVVTALVVLKRGFGYGADTRFVISSGAGSGAAITPTFTGTSISGGTITNGGSGYTAQSLVDVMHIYDHSVSVFPQASVTPANNGEVMFQLTSNTSLTFKVKGLDGVVRSGSVTLA